MHWETGALSTAQHSEHGDEAAARLKAREAYLHQAEADAAASDSGSDCSVENGVSRAVPYSFAPRQQWDCESVLSHRSTSSYQPACIESARRPRSAAPLQLSSKTGLPRNARQVHRRHASVQHDANSSSDDEGSHGAQSHAGTVSTGKAPRPKGESPQDRKARKAAVKAERKEARSAKKQLKGVYAQERTRAQHQAASNADARVSVVSIA